MTFLNKWGEIPIELDGEVDYKRVKKGAIDAVEYGTQCANEIPQFAHDPIYQTTFSILYGVRNWLRHGMDNVIDAGSYPAMFETVAEIIREGAPEPLCDSVTYHDN
jgi:hypothetical protein